MMQLSFIFVLVLAVAVALFAIQNNVPVQVRLLAWTFESSLVVVILTSAALGAALATFLGLPGAFRIRWRLREQLAKVQELERRFQDAQAQSGGESPQKPPSEDVPKAHPPL
ncbi:MAG: LapA family protein [candidate division NC10 bacterium]|nr:LapA family protein [candidate division NC10 bacterium]